MELIILALCFVIAILLSFLSFYIFQYKSIKTQIKNNPGYETQMILADLMTNGTFVRIERVSPEHFFLRRP